MKILLLALLGSSAVLLSPLFGIIKQRDYKTWEQSMPVPPAMTARSPNCPPLITPESANSSIHAMPNLCPKDYEPPTPWQEFQFNSQTVYLSPAVLPVSGWTNAKRSDELEKKVALGTSELPCKK